MALLGTTIGLDKAALAALVGGIATLDVYSLGSDGDITLSLNVFTDSFRSAAIKGGYSATSIDALTSTTCPEVVKRWILRGALDELTAGLASRPDAIGKYGDEARKWLSRLAGGAETIDALSRMNTTGGIEVRVGASDGVSNNTFDKDNVRSASNPKGSRFASIDPEI